MSEIIKKHLAAQKFLTKAKYLTKDFKVPLYTGSEEEKVKENKKQNKGQTQLEKDLERISTDPEGYVEDLVDLYNSEDNDTKENIPEIKTETIRNKNTLNYLNKTKPSKINGAINLKPKKDYRFRSFDGVNTWSLIRDTATTAEEKNNVKQILNKNYSNSRQRASMDEEDLKFINKHPTQLKEIEEKNL